jgi:hypothetical protein
VAVLPAAMAWRFVAGVLWERDRGRQD